ncbi:MAG TPA: ABC transporter substrate-binding protein [Rhizomicrobium sp.]|nr:ABC transporter substrate-binding protein [Rhizomicrobium sp.]
MAIPSAATPEMPRSTSLPLNKPFIFNTLLPRAAKRRLFQSMFSKFEINTRFVCARGDSLKSEALREASMPVLDRLGVVRFTLLAFALLSTTPLQSCGDGPHSKLTPRKTIVIDYTAPHEAINQIISGFRRGIASNADFRDTNIVEMHASGDSTQYAQVISASIAKHPDLLATITTPVAQTALQMKPKGLNILFLAVTDPVGAGLVPSLDRPGAITGVSDLAPYAAVLNLIRILRPNARRIGMPYSPQEQPAVFGRDFIVSIAPKYGFSVDDVPVTNKDELPTLLATLAGRNDILLIGSDNSMFEAAPIIVKTGIDGHIPTFAADSTSVKAGALGGYTIDYELLGETGARQAVALLAGKSASDLPVITMSEGVLELNRTTAAELHIQFPLELLKKAKRIYD